METDNHGEVTREAAKEIIAMIDFDWNDLRSLMDTQGNINKRRYKTVQKGIWALAVQLVSKLDLGALAKVVASAKRRKIRTGERGKKKFIEFNQPASFDQYLPDELIDKCDGIEILYTVAVAEIVACVWNTTFFTAFSTTPSPATAK